MNYCVTEYTMERDLLLTSLLIENGSRKLTCNQKVQDSMVLRREVSVWSSWQHLSTHKYPEGVNSEQVDQSASFYYSIRSKYLLCRAFWRSIIFQLKTVWQYTASGESRSAPLKISAMLLNNKITFSALTKNRIIH